MALAKATGLGNLITEEGVFPLPEVIAHLRSVSKTDKALRSQGFEIVPVKMKTGFSPKTDTKPSEVRILSQEEIILAEMARFAKNRPMQIIGVIMLLVASGRRFGRIGPIELHDAILQLGFMEITLTDVKRVLGKIKEGDLPKLLKAKERVGLARAYKLYR